MNALTPLLGITVTLALGAVSPGPSFLMVARTAVARSRRDGLAAALGMGVGGVLFAIAALLGLNVVLAAVPWLYFMLKLGGGAWLLYLGWRIWRGAAQPLEVAIGSGDAGHAVGTPAPEKRLTSAFALGFITQVSNPKTAVVYASVFAALLPHEVPAAFFLLLPPLVFAIETGWYALVAAGLSSDAPRTAYLRSKRWIDRAAGGALAALGMRMIVNARNG
jgi:threonine/homoserine/homoserine lactone efflux protein